nr:hypothetical protein [Pseudobdellovibrionaceae bacterium]
VTFNDLKRQINLNLDSKGRIILDVDKVLNLNVQTQSTINGISFIVESMNGFSTLMMTIDDRFTTNPTPVQPPEPDDQQALCRDQVYDLTGRLAVCTKDERNINSEILTEKQRVFELEQALARVNMPLYKCQENRTLLEQNLKNVREQNSQYFSQISAVKQNIGSIRETWRRMKEFSGKTINCIVVGRHERFIGSGPTLGAALFQALERCGVNNCGKNNWNREYRCDNK